MPQQALLQNNVRFRLQTVNSAKYSLALHEAGLTFRQHQDIVEEAVHLWRGLEQGYEHGGLQANLTA